MSNNPEQDNPKHLNFWLLLVISFVLCNLAFIIDQTFRWSNHAEGFMNGIYHILFLGIAWLVYFIPWSLLIFTLYKWRKWKRFRTLWVLAPAIFIFLSMIAGLIFQPPIPAKRFKRFTRTELPANIQNLHYNFSGGGIADYYDTYYFETTPEEVDRIISAMGLDENKSYPAEEARYLSPSQLEVYPDISTWKDAKQYKSDNHAWFYILLTDASRTKVYIQMGCY